MDGKSGIASSGLALGCLVAAIRWSQGRAIVRLISGKRQTVPLVCAIKRTRNMLDSEAPRDSL
jgi:hypothetical protein